MSWEGSSTWYSWSGSHSWEEGSARQPASTGASSSECQQWRSTADASSTPPVHQRNAGQPAREATWNSCTRWTEWPPLDNDSSTRPPRQRSARKPALHAAKTATAAAPATQAMTSAAPPGAAASTASTTTAPATALNQVQESDWQSTIAALNLEKPGEKKLDAPSVHRHVQWPLPLPLPALSEEITMPLPPRYWCPACSQGFVKWSQCRQHIYSTCKQNVIGVAASVHDEVLQNTCKTKPNFQ